MLVTAQLRDLSTIAPHRILLLQRIISCKNSVTGRNMYETADRENLLPAAGRIKRIQKLQNQK